MTPDQNFNEKEWVNKVLNNALSEVKEDSDSLSVENLNNREKIKKIREVFLEKLDQIKKEIISIKQNRDSLYKSAEEYWLRKSMDSSVAKSTLDNMRSFYEKTKAGNNIVLNAVENLQKDFLESLSKLESEIDPLEIKPNEHETEKINYFIQDIEENIASIDEFVDTSHEVLEKLKSFCGDNFNEKNEDKNKIKEIIIQKYNLIEMEMSSFERKINDLYRRGEKKLSDLTGHYPTEKILRVQQELNNHESNFKNWFESQQSLIVNGKLQMIESVDDGLVAMRKEEIQKVADNFSENLDRVYQNTIRVSRDTINKLEMLINKI